MLAQFTWQEFLATVMLLTLIWYGCVVLIFYRRELNDFISGKLKQKIEPLPHRWANNVEALEQQSEVLEDELLGKAKIPEGTSSVNIGKIGFASEYDLKAEQIGLVPDVLQELKTVFIILEKEDGNKNDFFSLMEVLREKYRQIGSNPNIGRINEFVSQNAPFHLSNEELENLWD